MESERAPAVPLAGAVAAAPGYRRRWRHLDKSVFLWALLIAILLLLVVNPLARLIWTSLEHPTTGAFTLENYATAYGRWRYVEALINSVTVGLAVALLCTLFGVPLAWAVSRTDMPGKSLVWAAVLGTFIMPNYLGAVAWMLLAGPNAGWLNRVYKAATGADAGPFNIYSMSGLVLVIACYSFPYLFVFTRTALDLISSEMEEAANTLGAGVWRTTLRVTLPLTLPAIMAAFIVTFLEAIALFGVPALIALPARFQVVTTMLWQFFEFPPKLQVAAAYSMPLLVITVALFWAQRRLIARRGYVSLTGKGGDRRPLKLGRWRWPMLGYCLFVTSLSFFVPMVVVLQAAFAKAWGRGFSLDNLTLRNVRFVLFDQPATRTATWNTFLYATVATLIALGLALAIAYIVHRRLVPFGSVLSQVAMAPFVTSLSFFVPMVVVLQAAFAKAWGRGFSLDNLTLRNVRLVLFDQPATRTATWNTFLYAAAASLIALGLALAIAYIVHRRLVPFGSVLSQVAMAPFVIPGIVLAIGFYAAYTHPPLVLYGTAWILILAFSTRFLPIAYANSDAAIRSINPELEDAARILGGSRLLTMRRVVAPLLRRGLAGAFILVFIPATRELSSAIFLYTTGTQVLSVLLFDKSDEGNFELLSSIGLILVVVTTALVMAGFRFVGKDFMLRRTAS